MSIQNENGTKVESKASMSYIQVKLAAELIDVLPERQEGWISYSAEPFHMQLGAGMKKKKCLEPVQRSKCFLLSVSFIKGRPG